MGWHDMGIISCQMMKPSLLSIPLLLDIAKIKFRSSASETCQLIEGTYKIRHCEIHKMHKITSLQDDKKKILNPKFWSHVTSLGSIRPLSQGDLGPWFYQLQFLVILGPYEPPVLVASHGTAKNPKPAPAWCVPKTKAPCLKYGHQNAMFYT
jgi:hypothetical protein